MTAGQLADALEVSPRTILRDITELSSAGIPVFAVRGSSGGFELLPGSGTRLAVPPPTSGSPRPATRRSAVAGESIRAHILLSPRGRQLVALSGRSAEFRLRRSPSPLQVRPGWTEGWLRTGPLENAVLDVLAFGTDIEVIAPPELRRALHTRALHIARLHAADAS
jgi:predicted DNA-binding transcriptional regulator YafY